METNWAADHLQTIRTLMERSAVYRRALAPVMLFLGVLGVAAAIVGLALHLDSIRSFGGLWLGTALVGVVGAFLITRRQALKDDEPFWSSPTRRVGEALLPPLAIGMCLGMQFMLSDPGDTFAPLLAICWVLLYGCALHAAGFFMPRGMKLFGWGLIVVAGGLFEVLVFMKPDFGLSGHWIMGFFFGVLHLTYGAYLYWTEQRKNAT